MEFAPKTNEPRLRTYRAAVLLVGVFVVGTVGFWLIGSEDTSVLDAIYMTAITLTTVGYGEVIDVSSSPGGKIFTVLLLFGGVGGFLYFFSAITAFVIEGTMAQLFWRRRMSRSIERLRGHTIVCGGGLTGEHVVVELLETHRDVVLIERSQERVEELYALFGREFPVVVGDAADDEVLQAAAVERAAGLVACVDSDKDNLVVTFSARQLNPNMRIVARSDHQRNDGKLTSAGADAIVSPTRIGGLRMASEMVRPAVVSFLDAMLRDKKKNLRIEEVVVEQGSDLDGMTVGDLRARKVADLLLVAIRAADGHWFYNPKDNLGLVPGMALVYIGSPAARKAVTVMSLPVFKG